MTLPTPEQWASERLYFDGDDYFKDVLGAIELARESVLLETYIFDPDPLGRRVEEALIRAARRGIAVRLLVDGIGAARWIERRAPEFDPSGVQLRVYHPVLYAKFFAALLSNFGFRKHASSRGFLSRLNRRDHRKVCVVDGDKAFVGSLNISADHCLSISGARAWRDTGAQLQGSAIEELIKAFDHAWLRSHSADGRRRWRDRFLPLKPTPKLKSQLVRLNFTRRLRRTNTTNFRKRLGSAERRVWLTNAYLAPSAPLVRALVEAATRGVEVRLLVPRKSDVFFMPWVAASHYAPLLKAGVQIFEYLPRFLHAKSVMIDGWATVGTSNMNRRSQLFDFEVDVVLTRPESLSALEEQFYKDLANSEEVLVARTGVTALLGRFFGYVFKRWI